jgi:hypothetical protein
VAPHIVALTEKIRELEAELDAEIVKSRAGLDVGMERGRAYFEEEIMEPYRESHTAGFLVTAGRAAMVRRQRRSMTGKFHHDERRSLL